MSNTPENSSDSKKQQVHQEKQEKKTETQTKSWRTKSVMVFDSLDDVRSQVIDHITKRGK